MGRGGRGGGSRSSSKTSSPSKPSSPTTPTTTPNTSPHATSGAGPVANRGGGPVPAPVGIMGVIIDGFVWGIGTAFGQRAVDAIMGPRTVEHVHTVSTPDTYAADHIPANSTPALNAAASSDTFTSFKNCNPEEGVYLKCLRDNNLQDPRMLPNASADAFSNGCSSYLSALKQCQAV